MNLRSIKIFSILLSLFTVHSFCRVISTVPTLRVLNNFITNNMNVFGNSIVNGTVTVAGQVNIPNLITTQGQVEQNSVALFADNSATVLKGSLVKVDDSANISINGITKNGNTVSWPSTQGLAGQGLMSDGAGNLIYATPTGSGNVMTEFPFSANNRLLVTDTLISASSIKQSGVTLDDSNNITGVNELNANTVTANLVGQASIASTAVNFITALSGQVTGTQHNTVVEFVGIDPTSATEIVSMVDAVGTATSENIANTIVMRDSSKNFKAGTIIANLVGDVVGNAAGNATSAINTNTSTYFTGSFSGDVTGTEYSTNVAFVGGQSAANISSMADLVSSATSQNIASTIVKRDEDGNFWARIISADFIGSITGNATGKATIALFADTAVDFTGTLTGDVQGTQGATIVKMVGSKTAQEVAAGAVIANLATNLNTAGQVVRRDSSGKFITTKIESDLIGSVTGSLYGNASVASFATNVAFADYATDFIGSLTGDVTGTQAATVVSSVGGKSSSQISNFVDTVAQATSNNMPNTIAKRDNAGNIAANKITLVSSPVNPTDAVNKQYVDAAVDSEIVPKQAATVVSLLNTSTTGLTTIDGYALSGASDRVMLVGQSDERQNGLWLPQTTEWTRPTDFAVGTAAGRAYVLTLTGISMAGSSWLCSTTGSIIGTDPIEFVLFSMPGQTTAANAGSGEGKIFRDKTNLTINLKTLLKDGHIAISTKPETITLGTNDYSTPVANSIVSRNAGSSFSANMFGQASLNVLKTGDSMSGALNMGPNLGLNSQISFYDLLGTKSVGIKAGNTTATYTIDLPTTEPETGKFLTSISSSATAWSDISLDPEDSNMYYVSKAGSDSNDGSLITPFETLAKAISVANLKSTVSTPVTILVGAGIFTEDNSGTGIFAGPLAITAEGISIVGSSMLSTIIEPADDSQNLLTTTVSNLQINNLAIRSLGGYPVSAIKVDSNNYGRMNFEFISISSFGKAFDFTRASGSYPIIFLQNIECIDNEVSVSANDLNVYIKGSSFIGKTSGSPENTAIYVTGSNGLMQIIDTNFYGLDFALSVSGSAKLNLLNSTIKNTNNGLAAFYASKSKIVGSSFLLNPTGAINLSAKDAGTEVLLEGSLIDCFDSGGSPCATAIMLTDNALVYASNSAIQGAILGVQAGVAFDTNEDTTFISNSVNLMYCTTDLVQLGSSKIKFVGGAIETAAMTFEKPENVSLAAFNNGNEATLSFGNGSDVEQTVCKIENGLGTPPSYEYKPNFYGDKGVLFQDLNNNNLFNGNYTKNDDTSYHAIIKDDSANSKFRLISDTSGTPGSGANVRGWDINRLGSSYDLVFSYTNNDLVGQPARGPNVVMALDGLNKFIKFPLAENSPNTVPKLIWASDTNLYSESAGVLKTDGGLIINGLSPNMVVTTDSSNKLVSSSITEVQLGYLSSLTGYIQPQINTKVLLAGDTMTGALVLPAGSESNPSLQFSGSTNTGLSSQSTGTLVFSVQGVDKMRITDDGSLYLGSYTSEPGVLHTGVSGIVTSTTVTNSDIASDADIADSKLATIASLGKVQNSATTATSFNIASAIVARDVLGSFTATTIYASLAGNATYAGGFTGNLYGDVTGQQSATVINSLGGKTAEQILAFLDVVNTATSSDSTLTIVSRDSLGSFTVNMVSLDSGPVNYSDMATKSYTDYTIDSSYVGTIITPGTFTITQDGLYTLTSNLSNTNIVVNTNNVTIDLRDYTLSAATDIITVNGECSNIEIKNGKIESTGDATTSGIRVMGGCSRINMNNLKIYSAGYGIYWGQAGITSVSGSIQNCMFNDCDYSVYLDSCNDIIVQNCISCNSRQSSFYNSSLSYGVIDSCYSLDTNNSDSISYAFYSSNGVGNIFKDCVVEGINKSGNTLPYSDREASGYYLNAEAKTEVKDCLCADLMASSTACRGAGININPTVGLGVSSSALATASRIGISSLDWSPDGRYLAASVFTGFPVALVIYRLQENALVQISSYDHRSSWAQIVKWHPSGKYLALSGTALSSDQNVRILSFNGSSLSLFASFDYVYEALDVSWSPDGKYLAVCGYNAVSAPYLRVLRFDPTSASILSQVTSIGTGSFAPCGSISWSPDGKYLAAGMLNAAPTLRIFQFTGSELVNIVNNSYFFPIYSLAWDPYGRYIAACGTASSQGKLVVFVFDPTLSSSFKIQQVAEYVHGAVDLKRVCWSPNQKYIASVGSPGYGTYCGRILNFSGNALTLNQSFYASGYNLEALSISKDGKYIAFGGYGLSDFYVYDYLDFGSGCLIKDNIICGTTSSPVSENSYSRYGVGIMGCGENLYLKNICYANDVNFNTAVYNNYGSSLLSCNPKKYDNLWQPAYDNSYGISGVCC